MWETMAASTTSGVVVTGRRRQCWFVVTVAAGVLVSVAGCSSNTAVPTTTVTTALKVTVTTTSLPSPSVVSSSAVPTVASTVATSSPSTAGASTTSTPSDPTVAVRAGRQASFAAYLAAVLDLDRFDPATIRTAYASPLAETVVGNIQVLISNGWRTRPGPQGDWLVIDSVVMDDATHATVVDCTFSDAVIFDPSPAGGASEIIVNSDIESRHAVRTMVLENGVWKNSDSNETRKDVGANTCGPRP